MKELQFNPLQFENRFNRRNIDVDQLLDDLIWENQNMHFDPKTGHDDDTTYFDKKYLLYEIKFAGVKSIISNTSGILVDNHAFAERLALMFKSPFCKGAVCFTVKNPKKLDILNILGQNFALKNKTGYNLYIAFSIETTSVLNKINETIFQKFLLDCDNFDIMCIDKKFNFNGERGDFFSKWHGKWIWNTLCFPSVHGEFSINTWKTWFSRLIAKPQ